MLKVSNQISSTQNLISKFRFVRRHFNLHTLYVLQQYVKQIFLAIKKIFLKKHNSKLYDQKIRCAQTYARPKFGEFRIPNSTFSLKRSYDERRMNLRSGTLTDRLPRLFVRKIELEKEEAPVVEFCLFPSQKLKHLLG